MSLADIVSEIKKLKPFIDEDVDTGPVETLSGRRGRKNQAIVRMGDLQLQYREEMMKSAVFIIAVGTEKDAFADIAEKSKCLVANPDDFYTDLATRLAPAVLSGKQTMDNAFDVLGRHLEDKALELGLSGYPQVVFKQHYGRAIKSKEELTVVIKQAINEQMGSEIVGIQAVNGLVKSAIEKSYKEKFAAIILPTNDMKLQTALLKDLRRLSPNVFSVVAGTVDPGPVAVVDDRVLSLGEEVSQKSVRAVLTKIRNILK